jgi:hypothetical protein
MILLPPALIQPAPTDLALPGWFPRAAGLEVKPQSLAFSEFDQELFELRNPANGTLLKLPVEGRIWRFVLRSEGPRLGALALLERLRPALETAGWTWTWVERGIARKMEGQADTWFRVTAGATGELRCLLLEKAPPPRLELNPPGAKIEQPAPQADFPYLTPWPGATLTASAPSRSPVGLQLPDGTQTMALVNWIEKEYQLAKPITSHAFLAAYKDALRRAGWEIEGSHKGVLLELQAFYQKEGRDIRAVLRFGGDVMGIAVADVGAQVPKAQK